MHRTRIKICGITRPADAVAAAEAGADAIGMVLYGNSKRLIQPSQAREIVRTLPPFVPAIGLFVDAEANFIVDTAKTLGLAAVQLHGHESPEMVAALAPVPVIKAVPVNSNLAEELARWRSMDVLGLLLDSSAGGGSGRVNDWDAIASADLTGLPPLIVAGGLNASNVGEVVRTLLPWAVDVSSGVELSPGEKSRELIEEFIAAVRRAFRPD